jgi:Flp pilus assembly protein TadG
VTIVSTTPTRRGDRGAAAVEFALVLPILLVLVLGIVEFGRAYFVQTTLSGAAREGVRIMALKDDAGQATSTVQDYAAGLGVTGGQIAVSPGACTPGSDVTVTITYPMDYITGFFGSSLTLTGKGTMRCGG